MHAPAAGDRIEKEKDEFFQRVRQAYIDLAENNPQRICLVDASKELAAVQEQVKQKLIEYKIIKS